MTAQSKAPHRHPRGASVRVPPLAAQPVRAATVAGGLLGATVADLFMPLFSGRLVDALTGRRRSGRAAARRSPPSAPSWRSAWSR